MSLFINSVSQLVSIWVSGILGSVLAQEGRFSKVSDFFSGAFKVFVFLFNQRQSNLILKRVICSNKLLNLHASDLFSSYCGCYYCSQNRNLTCESHTCIFSCQLLNLSIWGSKMHLLTLCSLTTYDDKIWVPWTQIQCGKIILCTFGIARHGYGHNYPIYNIKFHDLYKDFLVENGNFFIKKL